MTLGRLIVLEGPDGGGKSTTAEVLAENLRASGKTVHLFAFPGNESGTVGRLIYDLHHKPETFGVQSVTPACLQVLHAAAHIDAIQTKIRPAFERGDTIIMDRFWWSTIIYGREAGVDERTLELLELLARHHWGFAIPSAAFVLFGPKERLQKAGGNGLQLRLAYCRFLESLETEFPVYSIERQDDRSSYAEQIVAKLDNIR